MMEMLGETNDFDAEMMYFANLQEGEDNTSVYGRFHTPVAIAGYKSWQVKVILCRSHQSLCSRVGKSSPYI